ncbi:MAG: hypothetical protein GY737_02555 [Desulfobacteraceae bacterium]|nr:hypothetical protein [Desulfobacteraceae bacterium]
MKKKKKCKDCECLFEPDPRHPKQKYCTREKCRKARKAQWQRNKLANDELYRQNQKDCQNRWREKNPDYWKNYRKKNPAYTAKNREKQRARNRIKRSRNKARSISTRIANMDVEGSKKSKISGRYMIIPCDGEMIANMDAVIVEINEITDICKESGHDCKDTTLFIPKS